MRIRRYLWFLFCVKVVMKIVALSDIHSRLDCLKQSDCVANDIKNADIVLISGDITDFGDRDEAMEVFSVLRSYNSKVYGVPGNCDLAGVDQYLKSEAVNLNCNCVIFGSVCIAGIGGCLDCQRHRNTGTKDDGFSVCLEHIIERKEEGLPLVFVSHYPPFNTLVDQTSAGKHGGSRAVKDFITEYQPLLSITGHIHEASGTDKIGATTLVNPGSFRVGSYAVIDLSDKVESVRLKRA